jgi:hypothetical protein
MIVATIAAKQDVSQDSKLRLNEMALCFIGNSHDVLADKLDFPSYLLASLFCMARLLWRKTQIHSLVDLLTDLPTVA